MLKSVTANANKAYKYSEEELRQIKNRIKTITYHSALENKYREIKSIKLDFDDESDCNFIYTFKNKPSLFDAV